MHTPVLLDQTLTGLEVSNGRFYVDATFGCGGLTTALLKNLDSHVLAVDRDPQAIAIAQNLRTVYSHRLKICHGCFSTLTHILKTQNIQHVDGIVFDLGVSSLQLETPERGFSFRLPGPLDMRMGLTGPTVKQVINTLSRSEIERILRTYGEEPNAKRIAHAIVHARDKNPITQTLQLSHIIHQVSSHTKIHPIDPATRTFQAFRIYINNELEALKKGLEAAEMLLKPGGRLVVISFHSLEDRIVKNFIRKRIANPPSPSRYSPHNHVPSHPSFRLISPQPIRPSQEEIQFNPRARSARLRLVERTQNPFFSTS